MCIYTPINILACCRKSNVTLFIAVVDSSVFLSEILSVSIFSFSVSDYLLRAALIEVAVFLRRYFVLHCLPPIPRPKNDVYFLNIPTKCNYADDKKYKKYVQYKHLLQMQTQKLRFCYHVYNNQMSVCPSQPIFPKHSLNGKNSLKQVLLA